MHICRLSASVTCNSKLTNPVFLVVFYGHGPEDRQDLCLPMTECECIMGGKGRLGSMPLPATFTNSYMW